VSLDDSGLEIFQGSLMNFHAFLLARRPRKGVSVWIFENKGSNRCKLSFFVLCVFVLYRCLSAPLPSIDS